jgi:predicted ATP-grasp superfamily ATP-dependent carboligase
MTDVARRVRASCVVTLVLVGLAACNSGEEKGPKPGELIVHGTVHMVAGADSSTCWKFTSTKGKDYELQPAQVPNSLLVDNVNAKLIIKPLTGGGGSFCKLGPVVTVDSVDSVSAGGSAPST